MLSHLHLLEYSFLGAVLFCLIFEVLFSSAAESLLELRLCYCKEVVPMLCALFSIANSISVLDQRVTSGGGIH